MSEPARRRGRATYEDLLAVPDAFVAEILDGELYATPRPGSPHARAASILAGELSVPFDRDEGQGGPGGWWILFEPELHLEGDVLVPDIAGWWRSRVPVLPDVAYFEICPDWVCGIVSPATERMDRGRKRSIYAREGVGHLWLLSPASRTLEVFRLAGKTWSLVHTFEGEGVVHVEPFADVGLDMSRWRLPKAPD